MRPLLRRLWTPALRRAALLATTAAAWVWWLCGPTWPESSWSLPSDGHERIVHSPDCRTAVTGRLKLLPFGDARVTAVTGPVVRDAATGRERFRLLDDTALVWLIQFSPDGRSLAVRGW